MQERVQKLLSRWGIASRRQAEELIGAGRVRLNGAIAHRGQKADPAHDVVEVDGKRVLQAARPPHLYLLLHKPAGVVSTCADPQHRATVLDLLPPKFRYNQGLHLVGRLDIESTGALILTNDGELTHYLTHPRHYVSKTYEVWVEGSPSEATLQHWRAGVWLDDRLTLPANVKVMRRLEAETQLQIVIREGRNRQIRRVAEQLGHPVRRLHRSAIGAIHLQQGSTLLALGHYRPLTPSEISSLKSLLNSHSDPVSCDIVSAGEGV
ncbi:pseudouridine synthase [Myxacorys almedinensis]|uniref:Pseudouridine synthase n=1 Tax=Myxacorys almedinensis A TaxID=2690445 RepID=A0A8J7Z404_9CYAN|nr:pseudouridine synthase [Myxacorys almedinensis]NDJ18895.1 pseudouridine synthase [Myxacorys almedinensis A]